MIGFTYVDKLPEKRRSKHYLQRLIEDFVESGQEIARIDYTEHDYKSLSVCYGCIKRAAITSKRPVKVVQRDGEVYLTKI